MMLAYDVLKFAGALVLILSGLGYWAMAVGKSRRYHTIFQSLSSMILLPSLIWFEFQIRKQDWRHFAEDSPYFSTYLYPMMIFHLLCAVPCILFWLLSLYAAIRSKEVGGVGHAILGRITLILYLATYFSGLLFYYLAFKAH